MIYLSHSYVIETIRTVKHHTLYSQRFRQIFSRFCFSCTGWSLGGAIVVEMESPHQGTITSISQWRDHQSKYTKLTYK